MPSGKYKLSLIRMLFDWIDYKTRDNNYNRSGFMNDAIQTFFKKYQITLEAIMDRLDKEKSNTTITLSEETEKYMKRYGFLFNDKAEMFRLIILIDFLEEINNAKKLPTYLSEV
jgi:hypothetical protein